MSVSFKTDLILAEKHRFATNPETDEENLRSFFCFFDEQISKFNENLMIWYCSSVAKKNYVDLTLKTLHFSSSKS